MKSVSLRIFLGGLALDLTNDVLKEYFSKYGEIKSVEIVIERKTGLSKGYAFMSCADESTFNRILSIPHKLNGAVINCNTAFKMMKSHHLGDVENRRLYLGNLPGNTTDSNL